MARKNAFTEARVARMTGRWNRQGHGSKIRRTPIADRLTQARAASIISFYNTAYEAKWRS